MISKCGSIPIFTLQENGKKTLSNSSHDDRNSLIYSDREAKKIVHRNLLRTCHNNRCSSNGRGTPAYIRLNVEQNFVIDFNSLESHR